MTCYFAPIVRLRFRSSSLSGRLANFHVAVLGGCLIVVACNFHSRLHASIGKVSETANSPNHGRLSGEQVNDVLLLA
jgi:hypothetical protein